MKFLPILLFFNLSLKAQTHISQQKLYYFISKDSLLGVKNGVGKIIIPAVHQNFGDYKNHELVPAGLIYLTPEKDTRHEPHSMGYAYNRNGRFLFAPYIFDNGPDCICEGLMRFVKNKKMGFADRSGKIIIQAKFDYVSEFDYGIAPFCNGCEFILKDEHLHIQGGDWGYINKKGEELKVTARAITIKDQLVDSIHYLPYQFSYNEFEKKIIDSFNKLTIISKIHFVNYYSPLDSNEMKLHYEIVEKPSPAFPYYHVKAFEYSKTHGYYGDNFPDTNFFVTKDGRYFAEGYDEKIPLDKWINKNVIEAKQYKKDHPDSPQKF